MPRTLEHFIRDTPVLREAALRVRALSRSLAAAPPGLYTLCYHHVAPREQARFAGQLRFLGRHGTFVTADRAATSSRDGRAGQGRHFLVSFDDGYADNHAVALPVLRALAIPAILFLVSDWVDAPARCRTGPATWTAPPWPTGSPPGSTSVRIARHATSGASPRRRSPRS